MQKSETRHQQWEISDSLFSSLQKARVLDGRVSDLIATCNIHADGNAVGKFLQRSQSMVHSPFSIRRKTSQSLLYRGYIWQIRLKPK
jgi:hypothetical protein